MQDIESLTEDRVLIAYPASHKLCASCSWNTCIATCHGAGHEPRLPSTKLRAKIDQNYHPTLPWNSQAFSGLQSSKIVILYIFCNCCLSGKTDFWCLLLHLFPESSLYNIFFKNRIIYAVFNFFPSNQVNSHLCLQFFMAEGFIFVRLYCNLFNKFPITVHFSLFFTFSSP